jgi:hypothetical protein
LYHTRCVLYRVLYVVRFGLFYTMNTVNPAHGDADFNADTLKKIGARIRALRIARGYPSYERFAFEYDISRSQLWRYENGEDLRVSSLLRILKALDVSLVEFFSEGF